MIRRCLFLLLLLCAMVLPLHAGLMEDIPSEDAVAFCNELRAHFEAGREPIAMTYAIDYRFLFIQLSNLAQAKVTSIEGHWPMPDGTRVPAVFLDIHIRTMDKVKQTQRGRYSFANRVVTAFTMPGLEPLVYVKQTDELINPMFGKSKQNECLELYDMTGPELAFMRRDYLTGEFRTNMVGQVDMTRQGREVPTVIKLAASVYHGERPMIDRDPDARVTANVRGVATPFDLKTELDDTPGDILGRDIESLRIDVCPAPEAKTQKKPMVLWVTSLQDLARHAEDEALIEHVRTMPAWHMSPLVADYALSLGKIRGRLTAVGITNQ